MIKGLLFLVLLSVVTLPADRQAVAEAGDDLSELKKEVEALKQGQLQLQRELQELKALVRRRQPVTELPQAALRIDGYPSKGQQSARVILIEFTDYQCPFCGRHFQQTWPQIERDYVNTGRLRYVVRDLPIESIHEHALKSAEATHCAGDQGQYWQMHDRLFRSQKALATEHLSAHAKALGLDVRSFQGCLDSGKYTPKIRQDLSEAQKMGVRATPTFFLGTVEPDGSSVKVVKLIGGAQPYGVFKEAIDGLLASAESR